MDWLFEHGKADLLKPQRIEADNGQPNGVIAVQIRGSWSFLCVCLTVLCPLAFLILLGLTNLCLKRPLTNSCFIINKNHINGYLAYQEEKLENKVLQEQQS